MIDTNVLITANNHYYAFDLVPAFWSWLEDAIAAGTVGTVTKVRDEIMSGNDEDPVRLWVEGLDQFARAPDDATVTAMRTIAVWTVGHSRYFDAAKNEFLRVADYYLVADALAHGDTVVTLEESKPDKRTKIQIPDVCAAFDVPVMGTFGMLRAEGAVLGE
nr:DUF4411 family protein [Salsipaludibacter albus]